MKRSAVMTTVPDIKRLLISVLIWTAVNAGIVLLLELAVKSVTAEVIVSAVFCLLWLPFAALFCRRREDKES